MRTFFPGETLNPTVHVCVLRYKPCDHQKKQKRFQDTNAKPLRLTTSQISSLRHSWIEENFLPEMPHPSHCTWIALAIRAVWNVVSCGSFLLIQLHKNSGREKKHPPHPGLQWILEMHDLRVTTQLKDWLQITNSFPLLPASLKCLKKVKIIHHEINLDHQKFTFMCVKRATPWLSKQSLGNPNLQNMQTCFWSSATREVWALLAPLRPSRSSLPARRQLDTKDIYGFNIYMFCTVLVLWVILQ